MDGFDLSSIVEQVKENGTLDNKCGNFKLDSGLASGVCQIRKKEWNGLAGPNYLSASNLEPVQEASKKLYGVLPLATPPCGLRVGPTTAPNVHPSSR